MIVQKLRTVMLQPPLGRQARIMQRLGIVVLQELRAVVLRVSEIRRSHMVLKRVASQ
jgi:hypothetical protein